MTLAELKKLVQYVSSADGEPSAVLVPAEVWGEILMRLGNVESGLHPIDENEPNAQILSDLEEAVRSTKAGETFSVSELWIRVYE